MMQARNENPLHYHTAEENAQETQGTLSAHLESLHGVDGLPEGESLAAIHNALNHGKPTGGAAIFRQALLPERRYASIRLGEPRHGYPGDQALFFEFLDNNGTNVVNLRPGDLPLLRAAVLPEPEGLKALKDIWSANLGPGARCAVEAGHAAGYRQGAEDTERISARRTAPVTAGEVEAFLGGLGSSDELSAAEQAAVRTVLDVLTRDKTAWNS